MTAKQPEVLPENDQMHAGKELLLAYRSVLVSLFVATAIMVVTIGLVALFIEFRNRTSDGTSHDPPIFLFVVLAGTLGALFSALGRLYTLEELPKALLHPDLRNLRNRYLVVYSLVPILIGAVSAAVVYLAFAAGYVSGTLFPAFDCKIQNSDCASFLGLFSYGPKSAPHHARALIWGFSSGFSERLVRDVLQNATTPKGATK